MQGGGGAPPEEARRRGARFTPTALRASPASWARGWGGGRRGARADLWVREEVHELDAEQRGRHREVVPDVERAVRHGARRRGRCERDDHRGGTRGHDVSLGGRPRCCSVVRSACCTQPQSGGADGGVGRGRGSRLGQEPAGRGGPRNSATPRCRGPCRSPSFCVGPCTRQPGVLRKQTARPRPGPKPLVQMHTRVKTASDTVLCPTAGNNAGVPRPGGRSHLRPERHAIASRRVTAAPPSGSRMPTQRRGCPARPNSQRMPYPGARVMEAALATDHAGVALNGQRGAGVGAFALVWGFARSKSTRWATNRRQ